MRWSRQWRNRACGKSARAGRWGRGSIRRERLVVQPDACCYKKGLPIDLRLRSGHGDPLAFADYSTELSTEAWCHVNNAAILKV